jgi:hypothetical protein
MLENAGMQFRRGRRSYEGADDLLDNPDGGFGGLMHENQAFTISALRAWSTAAAGVGVGLAVARFLDRWVATRKPANGQHPWYGANAAAAINRRPDAWRLGAQAAGGLVGMGLAYATRGRGIIPWLLGGIAIGFGSNITLNLIEWWLMPLLFKVKSPNEASLANRMYSLEQKSAQDVVDSIFQNWQLAANLNNNQMATPVVVGVVPAAPSGPVYTLGARGPAQAGVPAGKAQTPGEVGNQPALVKTGRLGMCESCGGEGGCWSSCPDLTLCGDCPGLTARMCTYEVQPGDDLNVLTSQLGIDVSQVSALNSPGNPSAYWLAGRTVTLPYAFCRGLQARSANHGAVAQPANTLPVIAGLGGNDQPIPIESLPFGLASNPEE